MQETVKQEKTATSSCTQSWSSSTDGNAGNMVLLKEISVLRAPKNNMTVAAGDYYGNIKVSATKMEKQG